MLGYAAKRSKALLQTEVPEIPTADIHIEQPHVSGPWSRRNNESDCQRSRKKYLLDVYQIGEFTGHKAEPASVAKSMRMSKSSDGSLLFGASEFLTPRQIANFSFRLSAKRVLPTDDEAKDEIQVDLREATEEKNLQDLSRQVL